MSDAHYHKALVSLQATLVGLTYLSSLLTNTIKQLHEDTSVTVLADLQAEHEFVSQLKTQAVDIRDYVFSLYQRGEAWTDKMTSNAENQELAAWEVLGQTHNLLTLIQELFSNHEQRIIFADTERVLIQQRMLSALEALVDNDAQTCATLSFPEHITAFLEQKKLKDAL
jgi:hypothetical protein